MAKILSRTQIIKLIAEGKAIVIYKNQVLNLTSWLSKHPGGEKAVFHMIGRDATDEMNAYHAIETAATFKRWRIGSIDYSWENLLPPIQGGVYSLDGTYQRVTGNSKIPSGLEKDSESDLDLGSTSSALSVSLAETSVKPTGLGFPEGSVKPNITTTVTKENVHQLFPVMSNFPIVDPQMILDNYDNNLAQQDVLGIPDLDYKTQQHLRDRYNELHDVIIRNGFYQCDYWSYVRELVRIISLFIYSFSFLKLGYYGLSATCMGVAWHQMTFIAHDAGHISITHNYQFDSTFGMLIASFFGGLSLGWWKRNHNVHHLITNDPIHDPDIQHLPFFAVSVRLLNNVYSTYYEKYLFLDAFAKKMIPLQEYLYYPILCFGRFNLYRLSWTHLILGQGPRKGKAAWFRYFEIVGLSFFFYWYVYLVIGKCVEGTWNKVYFTIVSNVAAMLVHVQITLSHFAMSTADLGVSESFPSRLLRTTMDVDCPEWLDFFHGGLQFQAIHHLFPRLPRHNLRRVQPFVLDFCKDVGLSYSIYGFGKGNEIIIGKLADIGKQCRILVEATKQLPHHGH